MTNKLIAITGGIGSGKSTVSKIIKDLGYPVFSADEVYKNLIKNKDFVKKIYDGLGIESNSYNFDKSLISSKVFNDKEMLKKLNEITHPEVMNELIKLSKEKGGVVFNEVPLLFESNFESLYDTVIIVVRNLNDRVSSVALRDNISKEEVLLRVNNQINYENIKSNAHTLICNNGSLSELAVKVKAVIDNIVKE
ncbi:MAG: dephospho-CoA kinase [Clostridia bacterium]|nr:dephospho-CoA kinase [Clostridia bacterium]